MKGSTINTSRDYLSDAMIENETPIVYSSTNGIHDTDRSYFCITSSHSQGFQWNQDIFVSQYQQAYQVEFDGHEDNIDNLVDEYKEAQERCVDDRAEDAIKNSYNYKYYKSRRKSENSISFICDSKNGIQQGTRLDYIDINIDSEKMTHLKWLLKQEVDL